MGNSKLKELNEALESESFHGAARRGAFVYEEIKKYFSISPDTNILDIGCGNGEFLLRFPAGHRFGVEFSESFGAQAKTKGIDVYIHDLSEGLPQLPVKFDLAIAVEILEHLIDGEPLLADVSRALKPGGVLVVSVPNDMGYLPRLVHIFSAGSIFHTPEVYREPHVRFFNLPTLKHYFNKYGFKVVRTTGYNLDNRFRYLPFGLTIIKYLARVYPTRFATNYTIIGIKK